MKKLNLDYEDLYDLYINKSISVIQISKQYQCSQGSISNYLKKYKIKARAFGGKGISPWNKGKKLQTNTGKTHFKKGNKAWNTGKKMSKEYCEKLSKAHIGQKSNKKGKTLEEMYTSEIVKKLKKQLIRNGIKTSSKLNKSYETSIERKIENQLLFNNILYIKQYTYDLGIADFWLPESNTIIECDGDYWHSLLGYKERDERQTNWLEDNDYLVYRFTETNINNNFEDVQHTISSI